MVGTHAAESPWSWLTPQNSSAITLQIAFSLVFFVASAPGGVVSAVERWAPRG